MLTTGIEFSGTLLGFDDYVSTYISLKPKPFFHSADRTIDMVLEDVTELYVSSKKSRKITSLTIATTVTTPETKKSSPRFF